jgi:hypothetical protein
MHWSIYDTMILLTGIIAGVTAIVPVAGVPAKTRLSAALTAAVLITAALYLGGLSSFRYPSFVFGGPIIALLALGVVVADGRKRTREAAENLQFDDRLTSVSAPPPTRVNEVAAADGVRLIAPEAGERSPVPAEPSAQEKPDPPAVQEPVEAPHAPAESLVESHEREAAWLAVTDPSTSPDDLVGILAAYPEFGPAAHDHPNSYPELRDWIRTNTLS